MAIAKKTVAVPMFALGGDESYTQGSGFPEGDYTWNDLSILIHSGFGDVKGPERLGVMITMTDDQETERKQFYSFGTNANKSFAPHESGKGIVPIPGGPKTTLPLGTNWAILRQSLIDCDPEVRTVFINDVSVFEGLKCHMQSIPEPEERAGFTSKTGDVETTRTRGTIAVVSLIHEKPWEETAPAKPATKVVGKPAAKKEPEPEVETEEDEATRTAAIGGLATALEKCTKVGMAKASVKTAAAKAVLKMYDADMMTAVTETYYSDEEQLAALIAEVGFVVAGPMVKPA
jgi:hypothetical protein